MSEMPEPRNPYNADAATLDRWEREAWHCLTYAPNPLTRADAWTFLTLIWAARNHRAKQQVPA